MNRASDVPPDVDSSGIAPVTSATAAATRSVNAPRSVRNASPLICGVMVILPAKPTDARHTSSSNQSASCWPVWLGLKRMLNRARATPGITLVAVLGASIMVTSRFDGWNSA